MLDFTGTQVVAIFAHPDDEAFTIGGVLSAFADRGATITLITATRGEEGEIAHPSLATPENLGSVRERELLDAAAILGIASVRFLDFRDSGMFGTESNENSAAFIQQPTEKVAQKLAGILAEIRPDIVITFSEEGGYLHPDHVHIHDSVEAVSKLAPELVPHLYYSSFPREFFLEIANQDHGAFAGMSEERRARMGQPLAAFTLVADVDPYVDRKIAAFAAHKTQQPKDGDRSFIEDEEMRRTFARNEFYTHVPSASTAEDPLVRLASDLPGSTVDGAAITLANTAM
jgi:N-acetyl-1-D-myo-inositol-2-amino-2-deoxy-alpha-D-glucopyranoside deacetylase